MQRQARELGRLRTGTYDGKRPVRSTTWIVSSHAEHYVTAAAALWGGTVERWQPQGTGAAQFRVITKANAIDAILPPGDPLSQSYELWSRGGCQRRCDGASEELSCGPCLCLKEFGEDFHEQPVGKVCQAHTRLNVILPDMPDVGYWRAETKSFYAANEIAGVVDLIRSATRGEAAIPIRLRIEPRKRVANGKTKQYPVVVLEVRGATAGQVMSGTGPHLALTGQPERPALPPGEPAVDVEPEPPGPQEFIDTLEGVTDFDQLTGLLQQAQQAGFARTLGDASDPVACAFVAARNRLTAAAKTPAGAAPPAASSAAEESESSEDVDELWNLVVSTAPQDWTTSEIDADFEAVTGVAPGDAAAADMRRYLDARKSSAA
jgi:hypothetical protein